MARRSKFEGWTRPADELGGLIDWKAVPGWFFEDLITKKILPEMEEFYQDPENVRKFEEWEKKRAAEALAGAAGGTD